MPSIDPSLDYDFEDTPRFWAQQDQERYLENQILERMQKNDDK